LLKELDGNEIRLRIKIVLTGFVYHPDVSVSSHPFVGQNQVDLSNLQVLALLISHANGVLVCKRTRWALTRTHSGGTIQHATRKTLDGRSLDD
jgi:hypothetical protein